jgi:hypothetical protein
VTERESDTGASDASRSRSGKAPSPGAAITVDGTAVSGSTPSRAQAKAPEAGEADPEPTPATYALRKIAVGLAGKDGLAIVAEGRVLSDKICVSRVRFFWDAVAPGLVAERTCGSVDP